MYQRERRDCLQILYSILLFEQTFDGSPDHWAIHRENIQKPVLLGQHNELQTEKHLGCFQKNISRGAAQCCSQQEAATASR